MFIILLDCLSLGGCAWCLLVCVSLLCGWFWLCLFSLDFAMWLWFDLRAVTGLLFACG